MLLARGSVQAKVNKCSLKHVGISLGRICMGLTSGLSTLKGRRVLFPIFFQTVWKNSAIAEVGLVDFDFHLSLAWDCSVKIHHGSNAHIIWLDFIQGIIFLLLIFIISITGYP